MHIKRTKKKKCSNVKQKSICFLPIIHTTIKEWIVHRIAHGEKIWYQIDIRCTWPIRYRFIYRHKNKIKLLRKPWIDKIELFLSIFLLLVPYQQIPKINTTAISILTTFRFDWIESRCRFVTSPIAKYKQTGFTIRIFFYQLENKTTCLSPKFNSYACICYC